MLKFELSIYQGGSLILLLSTFWICIVIRRNIDTQLTIKLSNLVHSSYGNLLFAMASIIWASSVSVFGSDLKEQWFENKVINWETLIFIFSVCIAMILGFLHYIGQQRKEHEKQSRPPLHLVKIASDKIMYLTRMYTDISLDWESIINDLENATKDEIQTFELKLIDAKKEFLKSMIHIAKHWNEAYDDSVIFKANLFNLIDSRYLIEKLESNSIDTQQKNNTHINFSIEALNNSPFFLFNDNWKSKLERSDYIIINEQMLSVSEPSIKNEKAHHPICMPYSDEYKEGHNIIKQPNLHGAPTAKQKNRLVYIPSLKQSINSNIEILERSSIYKKFINNDFKQNLLAYYENDSAGSLMSIPIHKYNLGSPFSSNGDGSVEIPQIDEEKIICIMNIYANKEYIFANHDVATAFVDITKPIWYMFSILVSLRISVIELNALLSQMVYTEDASALENVNG